MVAAIKTEAIKQEVSAAEKSQRDLEDSEYGPNPEGELNAGCRKCNVVFGTAVELKVSGFTFLNAYIRNGITQSTARDFISIAFLFVLKNIISVAQFLA